MSRKLEKKEISGVAYECVQFDVRKSLRVLTQIGKYLGGPMSKVMQSIDPKQGLLDQDLSKVDLGGAVTQMMGSMGPDDLYAFAKDVCASVIAQQKPGETIVGGKLVDETFDQHFHGQEGLLRLVKVLQFALEVNYGSFFAVAGAAAGLRKGAVPA